MSNFPRGPGTRPPPPPTSTNGWGQYVALTLEDILSRLRHLEQRLPSISHASDAPTTKEPSRREIWNERKETAREVGTALKWLAAIVLLVGLILKKIDGSQLQMLRSWLGMPG